MPDILPFLTSLTLTGLAELGDKTQLLTIALASRYSARSVITGAVGAVSILMLAAVAVGSSIYYLLPPDLIQTGAGITFIFFGIWILRSNGEDETEKIREKLSPALTVFLAYLVAEMGDKTQLAAIPLSAKFNSPYQVFLGATLGMLAVTILGVFICNRMGCCLPREKIEKISGILFIAFGVISLVTL